MNENSAPVPADDLPAADEPGPALPADTGGLPGATPPREEDTFPIVGIGASAGGLEALEQFLQGVPPGSGMAFVVVQHLDPTHAGMLPELLQRVTPMPVVQVAETVAIRPDTVYVIPPGHDLALLHRNLHLLEPHAPRGLRLPIDFFFRSLADDLQERGIGVVLSGMGSDGTLGLRAIKEKAGLALVQDPASAKFDGMPRSAIGTGLADIITPAGELPERILAFVRHLPLAAAPEPAAEPGAGTDFDRVVILLRARTGHDFSLYKKTTVNRRIERRMAIHQLDRTADYVRFLQENPAELDLLLKELLIGVTSFFRDPAVWEALRDPVIPGLIAAAPDGAMRVVSANRSFSATFGVPAGEVEGRELFALGNGAWDITELRQLLEKVLPENSAFDNYRVDHVFPGIGRRVLLLNARRVVTEGERKELILLAFEDVTGTEREDAP